MYKLFNITPYPPVTVNLKLEETIEKLKSCAKIIAIALIGTTASNKITETSDYDIFIIIDDDNIEIDWLITYIDHRISDVHILRKNQLTYCINEANELPFAKYSSLGVKIHMLKSASIIYDPENFLEKITSYFNKTRFKSLTWNDQSIYERYFHVNASIRHRIRTIDRYTNAFNVYNKLLIYHTLNELYFLYFIFRNIDVISPREKLLYLKVNDAKAYRDLNKCLDAWTLKSKLKHCINFAQIALEPVGGLWPETMTVASKDPRDEADIEKIKKGIDFWNSIFV